MEPSYEEQEAHTLCTCVAENPWMFAAGRLTARLVLNVAIIILDKKLLTVYLSLYNLKL